MKFSRIFSLTLQVRFLKINHPSGMRKVDFQAIVNFNTFETASSLINIFSRLKTWKRSNFLRLDIRERSYDLNLEIRERSYLLPFTAVIRE